MYPSEYAYHVNSVNRAEGGNGKCRMYASGLILNDYSENYMYCRGVQLTLADSDLGPEQYTGSSDYYVWGAKSGHKPLLFTFSTRVNLTSITLHYYSDSDRGLSRLRFFAVSDNFNIWNTTSANSGSGRIDTMPPDGKQAGRRSVSITVNFNTRKVQMYKVNSDFEFAVSEVEFFTCNSKLGQCSDIRCEHNTFFDQDLW